jgi:hypothetical protein
VATTNSVAALISSTRLLVWGMDSQPPQAEVPPVGQATECGAIMRYRAGLTLERHGARTLASLRVRAATRLLCLAACISLNHQLGRPIRSLVAYMA